MLRIKESVNLMEGKPLEDRYTIESIVDDTFLYCYCKCGWHTVVKINYCPMCR